MLRGRIPSVSIPWSLSRETFPVMKLDAASARSSCNTKIVNLGLGRLRFFTAEESEESSVRHGVTPATAFVRIAVEDHEDGDAELPEN